MPLSQFSVIIAGGTGSTGREIVSRLVAHPRVSRVVVLSRYPIPVNRWHSFFPNLRVADALKHLSVVAVDWERIQNDTRDLPLSALRAGEDIPSSPSSPGRRSSSTSRRTLFHLFGVRSTKDFGDASLPSSSVSSTEYLDNSREVGVDFEGNPIREHELDTPDVAEDGKDDDDDPLMRQRFGDGSPSNAQRGKRQRVTLLTRSLETSRHLHEDGPLDFDKAEPASSSKSDSAGGGEQLRSSRRLLHDLMKSTFYRSIFAGHHVAVNCLGTHNFFSKKAVTAVDHDYAIAFAKLVRIFNCYCEDPLEEQLEEEVDALRDVADSLSDPVLWREVIIAYLGLEGTYLAAAEDRAEAISRFMEERKDLLHKMQPSAYYSSNSTSSSNPLMSGTGGVERHRFSGSSSSINTASPSSAPKKATLHHFTQVSAAWATPFSPLPYFRAHGICDEEVLQIFNRSASQKRAARRSDSSPLASRRQDDDDDERNSGVAGECGSSSDTADEKRLAKKRSRASAKFLDNAHVSIWKPGLLKRPNARWSERLLEFFAPPVSVEALSSMIVEEIFSSVEDEREDDEVGRLKIVSAKHVAVWAKLHGH